MHHISVRDGTPDDLPALWALNQAEVPRVNALELHDFTRLATSSQGFWVAEDAGRTAGFCWIFAPGAGYESANYRWFEEQFDHFWYLDRIVVAPAHRRRGVARALYATVFERAKAAGRPRVTCEVNVEPPNPGSLALHHDLGFVEVGRRTADGKTVSMLERIFR